jgi:hypothetical protein
MILSIPTYGCGESHLGQVGRSSAWGWARTTHASAVPDLSSLKREGFGVFVAAGAMSRISSAAELDRVLKAVDF